MFRLLLKSLVKYNIQSVRYNSKGKEYGSLKVCLCGAAGKLGQTTSLLLKSCPMIYELALYDVVKTQGIAMELNHIDTKCKVYSYKQDIKTAMLKSDIVAIVANAKTSKCKEDTHCHNFLKNGEIICDLVSCVAEYCPKAFLVIASCPINSLVPLASEVMKQKGVYNANHIFGVTTLDVMRANTLVAQKIGIAPEGVHVPCIGGSEKETAVPILSQTKPKTEFTDEEVLSITEGVQNNKSKPGDKTCNHTYLAGALALSQFIISLIRAMKGSNNVIETCYVRSKAYPNLDYLSTPVLLGTDGVSKNLGLPPMTDYEKCLFQTCREILKEEIDQGVGFVRRRFGQACS